MSYVQNFEFDFEVGDVYDLTPLEGTYVIGMILARGGECYIDGNKIIVSAMPDKETPPAAPAPVAVEPIPEPEPEPITYVPNVVEEAIAVSYEVEESEPEKTPPVVEEAPAEVEPVPIKRPRKPKIVVKEEIE